MTGVYRFLKRTEKHCILLIISWERTKSRTKNSEEWLNNPLDMGLSPVKEVINKAIYLRAGRLKSFGEVFK